MSQIIVRNLFNIKPKQQPITFIILFSNRTLTSLCTKNKSHITPTLSQLYAIECLKSKHNYINDNYKLINYNFISNSIDTENSDKEKHDIQLKVAATGNGSKGEEKASLEHLTLLEKKLQFDLPKFFSQPLDQTIYTKDLLLVDNIRGIKTKGLFQLRLQVNLIKAYYTIAHTSARMELLNLVKNPEESSIKIRWRIVTKPGYILFLFNFWRFGSLTSWRDGLTTMFVNNQGKVHCIVSDNIEVDIDQIKEKQKQSIKSRLVDRGLNV